MTSRLSPNQGMGVGLSASPEETKNGLWARLSNFTITSCLSTVTVADTSSRLRKIFLACARWYSRPICSAMRR